MRASNFRKEIRALAVTDDFDTIYFIRNKILILLFRKTPLSKEETESIEDPLRQLGLYE